eukprot:TRINITY_DN103847_c0_g1_i1.p1 TRINITY_DN103847_c0_g1~~TRINITY_DN103847_c0_g1_i1.p1  ORF type:complete len:443 (-),score=51.81 TRINITY_DN103847_c0_g1_i1:15-1343(-)
MDLSYLVGLGLDVQSAQTGANVDGQQEHVAVGHGLPEQPAFAFNEWLTSVLQDGIIGQRFPETCRCVSEVACGWRARFPGRLWARLSRDNCGTLVKEAREAIPAIAFVQQRMAALRPEDGPITILDLCSGLGFLGLLLAEILPKDRVHAVILVDQAWPLKGGPRDVSLTEAGDKNAFGSLSRKNRTRLNWDHIYELPWPVTVTTRRSDLKLPSTHAQILAKVLEPAPGPVLILGIHLCGVLSIRAIETFNRGPKCVGLVLKPCCLPAMEYVKQKTRWTLGAHSFDATEVCMWGRYIKNQWQGPVKATMASRFQAWAENLYRGILSDSKAHQHVALVEGHYQDAYLMASRNFSAEAPSPPVPADAATNAAALVKQVLAASSPHDILGVPESISMRGIRRRWTALTRALAPLQDDPTADPSAADAFKAVKDAFDTIRAQRWDVT